MGYLSQQYITLVASGNINNYKNRMKTDYCVVMTPALDWVPLTVSRVCHVGGNGVSMRHLPENGGFSYGN